MTYLDQLRSLEQQGRAYLVQKKYKDALRCFYDGALLSKKLEYSAPSSVQKQIWEQEYEKFKLLILKANVDQKKDSSSSNKKTKKSVSDSSSSTNDYVSGNDDNNENDKFIEDNESFPENLTEEEQYFVDLTPPSKDYSQIIGLEAAKKELSNIDIAFKRPELFEKLDVEPVKGILLFGPPGCGKTFLIECARGEFKVNLVTGTAADLKGKYVGDSEKKAKAMFNAAIKAKPAILFIDEIDKILPANRDENSAIKGLLQVFLVELIKNHPEYVAVLATNYPDDIEPAIIMNRKRINNIIYVGPPDYNARKAIFKLGLSKIPLEYPLSTEMVIDILAKYSEPTQEGDQFSAANCSTFIDKIKRKLIDLWLSNGDESIGLSGQMLNELLPKFKPDISRQQIEMYEEFARKWAER